jgi:hypothetical protein
VSTVEPKIRKSMAEDLPIELNDVGATPFMIGMAALAVRLRRIGLQSVKSFVQPAVGRYFLVAIETKPCLCRTRKWRMAIGTFFLELCMPFNERARHDQLFQYVLGGGRPIRPD